MQYQIEHAKIPGLAQPLTTKNGKRYENYWLGMELKNHPASRRWDISKTAVEIDGEGYMWFIHKGKRYDSKFLSAGRGFYIGSIDGPEYYRFRLEDGKVVAWCLHIHDDKVQESSNMGVFVKAWHKVHK